MARTLMSISSKDAWRGEADCRNCALRNSVLFAGLEERHFELIHRPIDEFTVEHGAALYRAGDPGDAVFTIRNGLLKLVQYLPDGNQRIVRLVRSTDVAGLEALLGQPYQHDAIALHPSSVCRIPIDVVRELDEQNPGLHRELMRRWQRALSEADAWLTELSTGTARQRVARLLLRLADEDGNGMCGLFSREDMGAMLGITTETASRIIAEFKRNQLLAETDPHHHYHCDPDRLHAIAAD